MPISFACDSCKQGLRVKDELAGRSVKCPKCGQVAKVPVPEPAEVPASQADSELRIVEEPPAPPAEPAPLRRPGAPAVPQRARRGGPILQPATSDMPYVLRGLAGGVVAALLGAFVWYLLAKGIKAKIGWVAWGIGWATGFGVVALSGGRGGLILCVMGAGTALLGWLMGEYMIYSWMFQDLVEKELLSKAAKSAQSKELLDAVREMMSSISFMDYLKATFGGMDAVFILLAAVTGWGVPQKMATS